MTNNQRIGAGFRYIYWGVLNTDGFFIGADTTGAAAGNISGVPMQRLPGAQTIPVSVPEDEVVNVTGDDGPMVSFAFDAASLPSGVMEVAQRDDNFEAVVQGTMVEALGDLDVGVYQPLAPAKPDICMLLMRRAKKWEPGVKGVKAWQILFIPRCTITPLGAELRQREATPFRYNINLSMSDRKPWGASFFEATNGVEAASIIPIEADNPIQLHCHVGDNSRVAFELALEPLSGAKTYVFINGYRRTLTTHYSVSGKTVTHTTAPATSAIVNSLYEVDEGDLG